MLFNNCYELSGSIGHDGLTTTYRGVDTHTGRDVAIRVLHDVSNKDTKLVTLFHQTTKMLVLLQHPNIVQVYDCGQAGDIYFIVSELVSGTDLRRYLRSRRVLDVDQSVLIAHDIASGLGVIHSKDIVHGDLKPQNILIGREMPLSIKMSGFGMRSICTTLGSIHYYAPEQTQTEMVSPASDVYSLGIIFYEMLTGRTPFDGETPVEVAIQHAHEIPIKPTQFNPNIPQALEVIVMKCLEKEPGKRFRNGRELATVLEQAIQ